MKKQNEQIMERLERVILSERMTDFETFLTALKSDVTLLLADYAALDGGEAVRVELQPLAGDGYEITVRARTSRLLDPGKMLAWET
jgi:septum formation topological specificity factor MinE